MLTVDDLAAWKSSRAAVGGARSARAGRPPTCSWRRASSWCTRARRARSSWCSPGRIELIKTIDGVERVHRRPRCRARSTARCRWSSAPRCRRRPRRSRPSRVLRIEPRSITPLAAASPEFARPRSARWRASASAGCRASPPSRRSRRSTMVGDRWDPACLELRRFLSRNQIRFDWLTLDDPDLAARWRGALPAEGELPGAAPRRRHDAVPARAARAGRAPRPADRRRAPPSTTPSSSAAGRPASPRRSTAPPRGCGRWSSSARRRAARRGPRRGSRTTSASRAASPATSSPAARCGRRRRLGAEILVTRSDRRHRSRRRARSVLDGGEAIARAHHHPRHRRELAAARHRGLRPADRQGHLLRRGAQRGRRHAGPGRPPDRRRQLGRPGGACSSPTTPAR